jgi:hypothetical protein
MTKLPQKRRLAVLLCAVGLGTCALPSVAEVQYKFSGFGTLGGVKTTNDDTEFRNNVDQFTGATKRLNLGVDSKIAVQGSAVFSNGVTLTSQVLGSRRNGQEFDVGFEWAYAQYTGIDGLDVKVGRVVLPAFLISDSRLVGYSMPWVRVPTLVYAMMPLSHVDGAQVTYRQPISSAVASVQFTRGGTTQVSQTMAGLASPYYQMGIGGPTTLYGASTGETATSKIFGVNGALEWGDWTFRLSQIQDHTNLQSIQQIPSTVTNFGPMPEVNAPNTLDFSDKFTEAGVQYDNGTLVVMAEHVKRSTKNVQVQAASAWYVGGGYRFGSLMPYAIISQYETTFQLGGGTLPPKAKGTALGLRYDFAASMALKAEFAQYKNNSIYNFTDAVSPAVADKKINVMSVALDFVF